MTSNQSPLIHTYREAQFIPLENTLTTESITDIISNTENMGPSVSVAAIGAGVTVPLVVIILIIIVIVVLVLVVRKRRAQEKPYQGRFYQELASNPGSLSWGER